MQRRVTSAAAAAAIGYNPAGDVLRVLRCRHRFHLECVDRWLLSSQDYSRPPACPMCNTQLEGGGSSSSSSHGGGAAAAVTMFTAAAAAAAANVAAGVAGGGATS